MAGDAPGAVEKIKARLEAVRLYFYRALWEIDEDSLTGPRRVILSVSRLVFVTIDAFFRERLQMRAAALAFFTLLSIVPAAALIFSVAKTLGAYELLLRETVNPLIEQSFPDVHAPGTPQGITALRTTLDQLIDLVRNTDVFGLGLIGFVVLAYTIHRVLRQVEQSFDAIWGFEGRRTFARRLPSYAVVTLFTPLALTFAFTVTAARQGQPVMATLDAWLHVPFLVDVLVFVLPPVLVWLSLLPVYILLPSARVRRRSAMLGALIGGLGWYGLQIAHVTFQIGVARQNAIYSGFGAFPIFLLWLHLSWVCVLLGAQVAAANQNAPTLRQLARVNLSDHLSVQAVALRAMTLLPADPQGESLRALARDVGVGVEPLRNVLDLLVEHGLLARRGGPYDPRYAPATDLDTVRVATVIEALGRRGPDSAMPWDHAERTVTEVLEKLHDAVESSAHNRTIGELRRRSASDDQM
ncbi:MAG: YihY family inner membrane protein [Myxococcales bacterium]|nr:YihY family inner membrane protein [Myxococcales bacterium]